MFKQHAPEAPTLKIRMDRKIKQRCFVQYGLGNGKGHHRVIYGQLKIEITLALVTGKGFCRPREGVAGLFYMPGGGEVRDCQGRNHVHSGKFGAKGRTWPQRCPAARPTAE